MDADYNIQWIRQRDGYRFLQDIDFAAISQFNIAAKESLKLEKIILSDIYKFENRVSVLFMIYPLFKGNKIHGYSVGIVNYKEFYNQLLSSLDMKKIIVHFSKNKQKLYESSQGRSFFGELSTKVQSHQGWEMKVLSKSKVQEDFQDYLGELILVIGLFFSLILGGGYFLFNNAIELRNKMNIKLKQEQFVGKVYAVLDDENLSEEEKYFSLLDLILRLPWSE